jgi:adenylate kinase
MPRNVIILLGYPGSGKGTQAKQIMRRLNIPQISTGDMLREEIVRGSEAGKVAQDLMAAGKYVDDSIVDTIVAGRIRRADCVNGFILDGYPRTVAQAETFSRELKDEDCLSVIEIVADPEHVLSRLLGRLMCPNCTAIYHLDTHPPKLVGVCDNCGANLKHRPDDERDKIEERFSHYRERTDPVIAYYKKNGSFKQVDGRPAADRVTDQLMQVINQCPGNPSAVRTEKGSLA